MLYSKFFNTTVYLGKENTLSMFTQRGVCKGYSCQNLVLVPDQVDKANVGLRGYNINRREISELKPEEGDG